MDTTKEVYTANIRKAVPIVRSPRVLQLEGIFDLQVQEMSQEVWSVSFKLPLLWNIGLIVGPSGSGKTTIANELWGDFIVPEWDWDKDKSIIDAFPRDLSIKDIVALLSSVGFSSPPSWLRPFHVLSNGEKFRVNMARTLAQMPDLCVIDEFTSVVDRTVAQIGSSAIAKTVRKRGQKLVAVSCHYDIIDWLEPDWIYNTANGEFTLCQDAVGRYLRRRPTLHVTVKRVHYNTWRLFSKFHYLDHSLNKSAHCYCAFINNRPVAFCAVLSFPHAVSPSWRISRLVCLPDYQGIGLGAKFGDFLGSVYANTGKPFTITMSHPALINAYARSRNWKMYRQPQTSPKVGKTSTIKAMRATVATQRYTAGFMYIGPKMDRALARKAYDSSI